MQIYRAHEAILRWMGLQRGYQLIVISTKVSLENR